MNQRCGEIQIKNLNLEVILLGGQSFVWRELSKNRYIGSYQNLVITLNYDNSTLQYTIYGDTEFNIEDFINFPLNLQEINVRLANDNYYMTAANKISGVRVIHQPLEETILSFIVSSNNSIRRIRNSVQSLIKEYGEEITTMPLQKTYPSSETISSLSDKQLKDLGLGYRAAYVKESARILVEENYKSNFQNWSSGEKLERLLNLPGVGPKVADCILVFTGYDSSISPIDVWTKRILTNLYHLEDNLPYSAYRKWITENFGNDAAHALQTIFEWYRQDINQ